MSKRASVAQIIHERNCEWGENARGYACIDIKCALTVKYNVSQHAQGQIWNISGRQFLIFSKYGFSGMIKHNLPQLRTSWISKLTK